ncbi:long-chain-fatty-acid--CoA ligase [Pseudalkalibacillus hwajinpoensis]|uniref:Long-chain-fatty-acid--CoA ligase n=1 Tax=Guptibacillus hwajinpoensis TaxID=208199 RepID=A0A4U1MGH4_9BACL|nr:long-chain-fatty-acid--CoA ligase [Pseudalkalibacillus hwajinpoensis]TKD70359.1 long-chain-fatty-acid--CoA ligase [Pseudalkalibacillus hwajinpoensis]
MTNNVEKEWFSYYQEGVPTSIEYENKPLQAYLIDAATKHPNKTAVHFLGKELTFQELLSRSKRLANSLRENGLEKGERVSIMLPNCPQAVISYYAVLMAGGVVVQTNPLYMERELEHQLSDSEATMMICLDLVLPKVLKVKSKTVLQHIVVTKIQDYLPFPKNLLYPLIQKQKKQGLLVEMPSTAEIHTFQDWVAKGSNEDIELDVNPKEDLALLQYTGGTTGLAKGVMLTHFNLVVNTMQCKNWIPDAKYGEESVMGILPFFHVYGMTCVMNLSIMYAAKMIILPKFEPKDTLKAIQKQKPTLFPGAPTIYISLLNEPDFDQYDLSSIKACISGSAPLPIEVQQKFQEKITGRLVEGYGLTESSPVTHSNPLSDGTVVGSIGLPWPDTDARVVTPTGEEAPLKEIGELIVKGPQVMKGYWNKPDETDAVLKDGWLFTGDMAYRDEKGYFYVVDRKKDMIIAGGYNIYPREVEEVLYEHPAVQEAVVIGIPDAYRGETVKAFVVLKQNENTTEEEMNQHCRKFLAAYKVPRLYEFRAELPKTTVGKILRRVLVDEEKMKKDQSL